MSVKQSKIYSFFQKKPSLSNESSPSIKSDSSNENDKSAANKLPNASGDTSGALKQELTTSPVKSVSSVKKRRIVDDVPEKNKEDSQLVKVKEENLTPKLKRKRIQIMDSSDEDEADIDKDDDVEDCDYKPGKFEESPSEDDYDDDDCISDEESHESIKTNLLSKSRRQNNKNGAKKILPKFESTPTSMKSVNSSFMNKENYSPSFSALNNSDIKGKIALFSSPKLNEDKLESSNLDNSISADQGSINFPHLCYPFLQEQKIKDKNGRRPDDPSYDGRTVFVPESHLNAQTPGQRQWWELKRDNFDTVLFFKMGKFYELFHMDAVLGVEKLGLVYMKSKEIAHVGFPEIGFQKYAEQLVEMGYKVARIEQTETPEMMEKRCKSMNRATKFDKVVRREICQVTSPGTMMGSNCSEAYLTAIFGKINEKGQLDVGVCFIDTAIGTVNLSKFTDDTALSKLETLLAVYPPSEILFDRTKTPKALAKVIEKFSGTRKKSSSCQFSDAKKVLRTIIEFDYFESEGIIAKWPKEFLHHVDDSDPLGQTPKSESENVLCAFGAIVTCLQESLIDQYVLSIKKIVNITPIDLERQVKNNKCLPESSSMILDNKTIRNLDLLSDSSGSPSLFRVIDKTQTFMGKRLIKQWICSPLLKIEDINQRQIALQQLNVLRSLLEVSKIYLKGMPDLEKLVSMIHAAGVKVKGDHPESRAIYFDQNIYSKKKIERLMLCLEKLGTALKMFSQMQNELKGSRSKLLKDTFLFEEYGGKLPNIAEDLRFFNNAFDRKMAVQHGKILPLKGVDEDYDRSKEIKSQLENDVNSYLRQQKRFFGSEIKFVGSGNNAYQLEVPDHATSKVTRDYTMSGQRKGFTRFVTAETQDFLKRQVEVEDIESRALGEVNRNIFSKFSSKRCTWDKVIEAMAVVDALLSLHDYSFGLDDETSCFPTFLDFESKPLLKIKSGRHPVVTAINAADSFIPNDFQLDDRLAILTGANMGGKSTLMRQTALLCVLAQIGCRVPAQEMCLTPVDRIFTRIGAADNIFERESTFFVELAETTMIMKHANVHSLVLIDELGRGTTTFDGCAIAHAVSKHLMNQRCRIMFSTHYHELTREYENRQGVLIYHMSVLEPEEDNESDENSTIIFLYTVAEGPCSKSHGFNAARLAGLPSKLIKNGQDVANKFEEEQKKLLELSEILKQN